MSIAKTVELDRGQVWVGSSTQRWSRNGPQETRKIVYIDESEWNENGTIDYEVIVPSTPSRKDFSGSMTIKSFRKWAERLVVTVVGAGTEKKGTGRTMLKDLLTQAPPTPATVGVAFYDLEMGDRFFYSHDGELQAFVKLDDSYVWSYEDQGVLEVDGYELEGLLESAQLIPV